MVGNTADHFFLVPYFRYLSNQPKNSLFQTSEFCGLKTW